MSEERWKLPCKAIKVETNQEVNIVSLAWLPVPGLSKYIELPPEQEKPKPEGK